MPNPKHSIYSKEGKKMLKRLNAKQKKLLRSVRRRGLTPSLYYRRSGNKTGVSVHVPDLDMKRNLKRGRQGNLRKVRSLKTVRRYPHAFDTEAQARAPKRTVRKALKTKKKIRKQSKYHNLFNP